MNPHFENALKALQRASESMRDAHGAMVESIREVLEANSEHEDLRETVERVQATVLAQTDDIKALRAEVAALRNGR